MAGATERFEVVANDGIVAIFVDAPTARVLAAVWQSSTAGQSAAGAVDRIFDAAALRRGAAEADAQTAGDPNTRWVPLEEPHLRLVGGERS